MTRFRFHPLALSVALLAPIASQAAYLSIDDTNPNDTISITAGDFENGFFVNGSLLTAGVGHGATAVIDESLGSILFRGNWIDNGHTPTGTFTVYFVEAQNPTLISDILQINTTTSDGVGSIAGTFLSDSGDNLGSIPDQLPPNARVIVEDGKPFSFDQPFLTASVLSDVDVPEASNVFAGLAVAGAIGAVYLRRRVA